MSYDVYLVADLGGKEPIAVTRGYNYTYNCAPMFYDVLPKGINGLNGKVARDVIPRLKEGIERMKNSPEKYKAMNPPNGWGDYESAIKFLENILEDCQKAPKATVRVC